MNQLDARFAKAFNDLNKMDDEIAEMREKLRIQKRFNADDYDDWIRVGLALKDFHAVASMKANGKMD